MGTIHVVGGGIAGLSCAVRCIQDHHRVILYEATQRAGGRCRSFEDEELGCTLDNGNHLLLSGNTATRTYIDDISANQWLKELEPAAFPFLEKTTKTPPEDLAHTERIDKFQWVFKPGSPLFPIWLISENRRVPGSTFMDYLEVFKLRGARKFQTVADCLNPKGTLFKRFWQPFTRAVLNTDAEEASAILLWKTIKMTFLKGEAACRPLFFSKGLSAALVTPAIQTIQKSTAELRFQARARGLSIQKNSVSAVRFSDGPIIVKRDDAVVLAVPPDTCNELWPDAKPPLETRPIVNIHFRLSAAVSLPGGQPFLGLIGTDSQWIFLRDDVLSITISAATDFVERPNWEIAQHVWSEMKEILGQHLGQLPPWRVIKERRATIAQTPDVIARRPNTKTRLSNLFLAGDWTNTGLPATIEGSVKSGLTAARLAMNCVTRNPVTD